MTLQLAVVSLVVGYGIGLVGLMAGHAVMEDRRWRRASRRVPRTDIVTRVNNYRAEMQRGWGYDDG